MKRYTPLLELLTYPEFLLTTRLRRSGYQPLPGTRLGSWLASRWPERKPRFPWKTAVLVIALLAGCWYAAPQVHTGAPKTLLANINTDDTSISTWIATGKWAANPAAACTAPAAKPAKAKPAPAKKPARKKSARKK